MNSKREYKKSLLISIAAIIIVFTMRTLIFKREFELDIFIIVVATYSGVFLTLTKINKR